MIDRVTAVATGLSAAGWQRRERWVVLLLLGPTLLYLVAMSIYPTVYSLWLAVHNYTIYRPDMASFAGIDNFLDLFDAEVFSQSFIVTILFSLFAVTLEFAIGLGVAILLDRKMAGIGLLRTLLIVPVLISPVGMGLTFRYILAPTYGLLTYLLQSAGIPTADWMASTTWALPAVILVDVWQWTPFVTLILLSGMQSVSVEVTEAAELDGLTERQKLWHIVLPLVRPIAIIAVLIRLIDSIRVFDMIFVLTRGGPGTSTEVLSIYSYVTGFTEGDMGAAAALAWVTVIFVNIVVFFFLRALSRAEGP
jgi:multiple sugar transport system permease protein